MRSPVPLLLTALALVAAAPAPAGAAVQELPGFVATPSRAAAAANARGDAVVAWVGRRGTYNVAFASRGGRFGRPLRVPGSGIGSSPEGTRIAVDERGDAVVAWVSYDDSEPEDPESRDEGCCYRVRTFVRRRSGRLTRVRTISPRGESAEAALRVAAAHGRMAVGWTGYRAEVVGRLALAGRSGRFRAPMALGGYLRLKDIALGRRQVTAYGERFDSEGDELLAVRFAGRRPSRGRTTLLRPSARLRGEGTLRANPRGDLLGLYAGFSPDLDDVGHRLLSGRVGRRIPARRFGRLGGLVALADSGRGVATRPAGRNTVLVRTRRRDGRLGRERQLRLGRATASATALAVNDRGRTAIAYSHGPRSGRRRLGVVASGRRRALWPRTGASLVREPLHVDRRGRVLAVFVARGHIRAWRG